MKIYFIIICLSLVLASCKNETAPEKAEIPKLDSIDYEVISAAIEELKKHGSTVPNYNDEVRKYAGNPNTDAFIICDSTDIEPLSDRMRFENEKAFDSLEIFIARRLIVDNKRKYAVENSRISYHKTYKLEDSTGGFYNYEKLYSKYPDAYAIIGFSKPSYSPNNEKASIYIYYQKRSKWGRGMYIWFRNENDKWIIYEVIQTWIS